MKQIITRVDDDLAEALKRRARRSGQSVNTYVTRVLRMAVATGAGAPASARQMWKVAALADGHLVSRSSPSPGGPDPWSLDLSNPVTTPAGYAAREVSRERDER